MAAEYFRREECRWERHPVLKGVELSYLSRDDGKVTSATCALVRLAAGAEPARHLHEDADDIVFVLEGRGAMWVEGYGDLPLDPGTFLRIPRGVLHQPHDIEEELVLYDVWSRNGN